MSVVFIRDNDETSSTAAGRKEEKEELEVAKRFKQKQLKTSITSNSDEPVAFKKRKGGNRNVRKRNDDD